MLQLIRYLKKFTGPMILVFALLAVQASCDLALPEQTSKIVDVGIQQGGIESVVPEVIREETLTNLALLMTAEETALAQAAYGPLSSHSYATQEPVLALAVDADIPALEPIFARAFTLASFATGDGESLAALRDSFVGEGSGMGAMPNISMGEGNLFDMLRQLPDSLRYTLLETIHGQLTELPETLFSQAAIAQVQAEYEAIGMPSPQTRYIAQTGLRMMAIVLLGAAATLLVSFLSSRIAAGLGRSLRSQVFRKVVSFGHGEMDQFSTASLITRSTNDIQQIQQMLVMLMRVLIYAPIMAIGGVVKVFNTETSMAWIIGVAVVAIALLVGTLFKVAMPRFKMMQKLVDRVNLVTREILTGMQVIRAFSTQKHEVKRFEGANQDLTRTALFVNRTMALMMPVMMLIMNVVTILILWNGSQGIDAGTLQVGEMMAFMQYAMQIIMSFLMISMLSIMLPRALVSVGRIDEILSCEPSIHDPASPKSLPEKGQGLVRFENVSFQYPGSEEAVLENISFEAEPGQTTAFIGSTGSGKSTLINLIPRFYDVTGGRITLDGVDIREVSQEQLRSRIGYVPQKGTLFSGTIASNISFGGREVDEATMTRAADIAQALDFIQERPQGFEDPISQGGANVSGGQKQRLSIARAIAGSPDVLIFDDSFSALDFKTDSALRAALKAQTAHSTVLVVAQRVSTILRAEQILVLDQGRIVGRGTHKELLATCPVYQDIAQTQLTKEELDA